MQTVVHPNSACSHFAHLSLEPVERRYGGGAAGRFSVTLSRQADRKLFEELTR